MELLFESMIYEWFLKYEDILRFNVAMDDVVNIIQIEKCAHHLCDETNCLHVGKHTMGMNVLKELCITIM